MATALVVTEQTMLPALLRSYPWVRPVLDRYGLRGCGGPDGPVESIAFFARAHDVDLEQLLRESGFDVLEHVSQP